MRTALFDFHLPQTSIAQSPVEPRDSAKLMVIDRQAKTRVHRRFFDIAQYLRPGDLLVWNNSKVFKARLHGMLVSADGERLMHHKKPVEIFLVRPLQNPGVWQALGKPGRHIENGMRVQFAKDFFCDVIVKEKNGTLLVQFPYNAATVRKYANRHGSVPLPPYVKNEKHELEAYQTAYAKKEGSVAAPTAGFHFTDVVIATLRERGVQFAEVTLHVGLGTFLPVKAERTEDHEMHSEWVEIDERTADAVNQAKKNAQRVVAVGTTTVRTLEGIAQMHERASGLAAHAVSEPAVQVVRPYTGDINLFITPGFHFRVIDALITNFHLPKSTLLMLVSAFAGDREFLLDCYEEAISQNYRFYSFGDAMFLQ